MPAMTFDTRFPPDARNLLISDITEAMVKLAEVDGEETSRFVAGAAWAVFQAHRRGMLHRLDARAILRATYEGQGLDRLEEPAPPGP